MIKIHEFDPCVYPMKLWVCVDSSDEFKDELVKTFEMDEKETAKSIAINGVTTCETKLLSTNKKGVLVFCSNFELLTVSNIAHESVHVADCIFEYIGACSQDFSYANEPYAYLVGWAAECISKVEKGNI